MILRFVDRLPGVEAVAGDWFGGESRRELLAGLAGPLGQPDWAVDVVLVDDGTMAGLNENFRKVPGVTDVLSFSYCQDFGTGLPDLPAGQGRAFVNLWLDTPAEARENDTLTVAGEVVLAPGFVHARCRRRGWPLEHEIPLLLVHGILHLLGWDHADEEQIEAMQVVEEEILATANLPHPLRGRN